MNKKLEIDKLSVKIFESLDELHRDLCNLDELMRANPTCEPILGIPTAEAWKTVLTLRARIVQNNPGEALERSGVTLYDWESEWARSGLFERGGSNHEG